METVVQFLGLSFVGIILICLVWTIGSYIAEAFSPNNKLEDNMKKWNKQRR
jgi:hypothetical protein